MCKIEHDRYAGEWLIKDFQNIIRYVNLQEKDQDKEEQGQDWDRVQLWHLLRWWRGSPAFEDQGARAKHLLCEEMYPKRIQPIRRLGYTSSRLSSFQLFDIFFKSFSTLAQMERRSGVVIAAR